MKITRARAIGELFMIVHTKRERIRNNLGNNTTRTVACDSVGVGVLSKEEFTYVYETHFGDTR